MLMFYGGFFLLLLLVHQRQRGLSWYRIPFGYIVRRADYLALPFVCFAVKTYAFRPWGLYASYNGLIRVGSACERQAWRFPKSSRTR